MTNDLNDNGKEPKTNIEILTAKANALAEKIRTLNAIAGGNVELRAKLSPIVMQMLRAEHVYIPEKIVTKYRKQDYGYKTVTLHPEDLLTTLPEEDSDKKYQPIFANSSGPWNADSYFQLDGNNKKFKVLWLLKEPYNVKWDKGDRGGHNQAEDFKEYKYEELYTTHKNLIKYTQSLFEYLGVHLTVKETMLRICIIQLNHFPGLSFKSKSTSKKLDSQEWRNWVDINRELLYSLFKFYNPHFIITGGVHDAIREKNYLQDIIEAIENNTFFAKFGISTNANFKDLEKELLESDGSYIVPSENKFPIIIQMNHPSYININLEQLAKVDSLGITKVLSHK